MASRLSGKLLALVVVLVGVSLATFLMIHAVPGDPAFALLGDQATASDIARVRRDLGLDRPLPEQYVRYVARAVQGDLGTSIRTGQPVIQAIKERFPSTIYLTIGAIFLSTLSGLAVGVLAAVSKSRVVEFLVSVFPLVGLSLPTFWSGLLLITLFGLVLKWVPVVGDAGWRSLVLPAVALALPTSAVVARMTRTTMLATMSEEFVRTARAKGVPGRLVVYKHALKAALIPVVTVVSLQFGALLGGAIVVESVFARPGLGRLAVEAILARDFPVIQGVVLVSAVVFVLVNFAAEMAYSLLDPRISKS
ncbi:MAG: ABC transporter permease [Trueperaceae bacterium]|nr:ABC transporter permease [Trueperaceae bacterium]MCC6311718.1 ABC transporter permease [Trueperaceae bacterium]MCO5173145.1 ABC transporter permease [Trueperaceae bacterium]MCW5818453.1 ABC transporter permease [Trueperaceae bacterium]